MRIGQARTVELELGGLDQDSALHFAASTFPSDGRSDYRPGLAQTSAADFNRVWAVSRSAIEALRQDWRDNGVIDQPVPDDLLTWPAKGNPNIPLPCPDIFGTVQNDLEDLQNLIHSGALEAPSYLPANVQLTPGQSVLLDATVPEATAYAWSTGATTPTLSVNQIGEYSVNITRSTGCATVETVLVTAATPTAEPAWLDYLRIFPNPSAGQFHVELRGAGQEQIEFLLYNALGQPVQRQTADFRSGSLRHSFDYGYLSNGIYTLQLRASEKTRYAKVVLQR